LQNDLTSAIRDIIVDNRSEFSADKTTTRNFENCEKAIGLNLIDFNTCDDEKLSRTHQKRREKQIEAKAAEEAKKKAVEEEKAKAAEEAKAKAKKEEEELAQAIISGGDKRPPIYDDVVSLDDSAVSSDEEDAEEEDEEEDEEDADEDAKVVATPVQISIHIPAVPVIETDNDSDADEDVEDDDNSTVADLDDFEDPATIPVGPSEHSRISVEHGLSLLANWKDSNANLSSLEETCCKMILQYQDRSSPDQVTDLLKFMTFDNKYKALIYLVKNRYPLDRDTKDMLGGIELFRVYKELFP